MRIAVAIVSALLAVSVVPAVASADSVAPVTTITTGPSTTDPYTTFDNTPTFGFTTSEPVSRVECVVTFGHPTDSLPPFGSCSGPGFFHTPWSLGQGGYTFLVRSIDLNGNLGLPDFRDFAVGYPPATPAVKKKCGKKKVLRRGKCVNRKAKSAAR